jgi:predicted DNA-binding WGR domain protein
MTNMRWALLKDPISGKTGKQLEYEIVVDGRVVTYSWGTADKKYQRRSRNVFGNEQEAVEAAHARVSLKTANGYQIAHAV